MATVRHNPGKWASRSQAAGGEYLAGVQQPRTPWAAAAASSESNYEAGVQESISRKAFSKGVQEAGDAKYRKGVEEKGRTRYQSGVSVSQSEYDRGFAPFRAAIEGVSLPPRGPKGQNLNRVQAIQDALLAAKRNR